MSYREIFRVLELMKLDMANYTLQSLRPHLKQQSVDYERGKFQEFLKTQQGIPGILLCFLSNGGSIWSALSMVRANKCQAGGQ